MDPRIRIRTKCHGTGCTQQLKYGTRVHTKLLLFTYMPVGAPFSKKTGSSLDIQGTRFPYLPRGELIDLLFFLLPDGNFQLIL